METMDEIIQPSTTYDHLDPSTRRHDERRGSYEVMRVSNRATEDGEARSRNAEDDVVDTYQNVKANPVYENVNTKT